MEREAGREEGKGEGREAGKEAEREAGREVGREVATNKLPRSIMLSKCVFPTYWPASGHAGPQQGSHLQSPFLAEKNRHHEKKFEN